jgi:hypothetical protein
MTTDTAEQMHEAADILRQFAVAAENGSTAAVHPGIVALFADWLGCLSVLEPAERSSGCCAWCDGDHAATIARAITHLAARTAEVSA